MDDFLTPISTRILKATSDQTDGHYQRALPKDPTEIVSSPQDALDILKSKLDYTQLVSILAHLVKESSNHGHFDIRRPSPESARIVQTMVSDIAPNYWALLADEDYQDGSRESPERTDGQLFLHCLRSLTAINALVGNLRALISQTKEGVSEPERARLSSSVGTLLDLLDKLLTRNDTVFKFWNTGTNGVQDERANRPFFAQLTALFAGGRLVSVAAEAALLQSPLSSRRPQFWLADGLEYSKWLGRNICSWMTLATAEHDYQLCAALFSRSLRLGYSDSLIRTVIDGLLLVRDVNSPHFPRLLQHSTLIDQKKVLFSLLQYLSVKFLSSGDLGASPDTKTITAVAGIINKATADDEVRIDHLINWCSSTSGAGLGEGVGIRRAVVAVLSQNNDSAVEVLEKCLNQFGDELYIKHAPLLQQDVHAQVLLLVAGYVHRLAPVTIKLLVKATGYLNTVSNRIGLMQDRSRFFGLIIGEALSSLVDGKEKQLNFGLEETGTVEAQWYKNLVNIADKVGPFEHLQFNDPPVPQTENQNGRSLTRKQPAPKPRRESPLQQNLVKRGPIIEVVAEHIDFQQGSEDLRPYAKPIDDAEDSEDDPTMVQRDRPRPPVYIRDLLAYYRDSEDYDKQHLALTVAPVLIRRKAGFGTEVSDHAVELASAIVGLSDQFEMKNFADLRQDAMVALIVGHPSQMAPWFGKTFFEGDYSLSQRAAILASIGMAAREIAGYEVSEYADSVAFPSKRLPEHVEKLYLEPSANERSSSSAASLKPLPRGAIEYAVRSIASNFLGPLAASTADAVSGPDFLKLSTFKARAQASRKAARPRVRAIPNTTASLLATSFFFPLTARFLHAIKSPAASRLGIVAEPFLLSLYVKTLAVVVHAAGPSTLALPKMTAELWDLVLHARTLCIGNLSVTHALLICFATILEINAEGVAGTLRQLCTVHGREIVETRAWIGVVFEGIRGDVSEEAEVKALAAGILVKLSETVETHRTLLLGNLIDR